MASYEIYGPCRLRGEITTAGAKNAALKQIAAALLTRDEVMLKNFPKIRDAENMLLLVEKLGAEIEWLGKNEVYIKCQNIVSGEIDENLTKAMRASVVLAGPLLARKKQVILPLPGGDLIGRRSIDTHLNGFKKLGVKVNFTNDGYILDALKAKPSEFFLDEMSVTATENLMMFATLLNGTTIIRGAAEEPEIEDLGLMLSAMGAKIEGAGTHTIKIVGVKKLGGASHAIIPDRIEIGTFACAAAASRGEVVIKNVILEHVENLLNKFEKIGVNFKFKSQNLNLKITSKNSKNGNRTWGDLEIYSSPSLKPIFIDTRPYPGFSTDLQAPMALLLTQAKGESRIFETLFENRFEYVQELRQMGAKIKILDKHNIIISGPTKLKKAKIQTSDIRAGATLVLAGLMAQGKTVIDNVEILERGYENFEGKLGALGAKITRI